jgi:hypothetical protein
VKCKKRLHAHSGAFVQQPCSNAVGRGALQPLVGCFVKVQINHMPETVWPGEPYWVKEIQVK